MNLLLIVSLLISLPLLAEDKKPTRDELILECNRKAKLRAEFYSEDPYLAQKAQQNAEDKCHKKYGLTFQE